MRLTYCFAICLMQIISYANGDETNTTLWASMDIKLETNEIISIKDTDILHIVVTGINKDGTPFHGKAEVDLYITQYYPFDSKIIKCGFRDTVNGKAEYDFNMTEVDFLDYNNANINIEVCAWLYNDDFVDNFVPDAHSFVKVYSNRYNLNRCVSGNTCSKFLVDVEQDVVYQITHVDGSYVNDTKSIVELTYSQIIAFDVDDRTEPLRAFANQPLTFTGHMNETGFVHFKVKLPELVSFGVTRHFVQKLKYLDEESQFTRVQVEEVWKYEQFEFLKYKKTG